MMKFSVITLGGAYIFTYNAKISINQLYFQFNISRSFHIIALPDLVLHQNGYFQNTDMYVHPPWHRYLNQQFYWYSWSKIFGFKYRFLTKFRFGTKFRFWTKFRFGTKFRFRYALRFWGQSTFRFRPKFRFKIELKTEIFVNLPGQNNLHLWWIIDW